MPEDLQAHVEHPAGPLLSAAALEVRVYSSHVNESSRCRSGNIRAGFALRFRDSLLLMGFCAVLFGWVAISGRPMTMHEARLPETSREMMLQGNWLIPMSGDRPWLERPPLPHWIMIGVNELLRQQCDSEWAARVPPALAGMLIVLMVAWMSAGWFGRATGVVAGLVLATMYEFYYYSTLAEDDIFLGLVVVAAMALFVKTEFFGDPNPANLNLPLAVTRRWPLRAIRSFFGARPWPVLGFFVLLGLTNLAKGPFVGAAVILGTLGVFLLVEQEWPRSPVIWMQRFGRYIWFWGILVAGVLAISWHWYIYRKFPEYLENLRYDFSDTEEFDQPRWYYITALLGVGMPWIPVAILALVQTARSAWGRGGSPEPFPEGTNPPDRHDGDSPEKLAFTSSRVLRFLWCWAIIPIVVLSLPHRKHHHYLVPSLAPWAILAALGLGSLARRMLAGFNRSHHPLFGLAIIGVPGAIGLTLLIHAHKLPGPVSIGVLLIAIWLICVGMFYFGLWTKSPRWLLAAILLGVGIAYSWGQSCWPNDTIDDRQFFREVDRTIAPGPLLAVNAAVGPLDFFQIQFYLPPTALLLHNLSYLRSDEIRQPDIFIVGRAKDLAALQTLGNASLMMESSHTRRETGPRDRFALFHLIFNPAMRRYPPPPVSPMQAMLRKPGPDCGPPLLEPP